MSDYFRPVVLSGPADSTTVAAFQAVMNKAQQTCPWLPPLASESAGIFYGDPPSFPRLNTIPEGLDDSQQQQWQMIYKAVAPIASATMRGEMQKAQAQGAQLANDAAFWDGVYRVTLDVATLGLNEAMNQLWAVIDEAKAASAAIKASIDLINNGDADAQDQQQAQALDSEHQSLIQQIISTIAPLGPDVRQQAGLGFTAVAAGITAAVVVTIVASVAVVVSSLKDLQQKANDAANAVADKRITMVQQALAAGQIDEATAQSQMSQIQKDAGDQASSQGAGAVGTGLAKAGLGVALAVGAIAAGYFLLKKKSAAPAAATNPRRRRR